MGERLAENTQVYWFSLYYVYFEQGPFHFLRMSHGWGTFQVQEFYISTLT